MPETLAIIQAFHSKTCVQPLTQLAGQTLVSHAIQSAGATQQANRAIVVTDDDSVVRECERRECEVIPTKPDADLSTHLLRALDYLEQAESYHPELIVAVDCSAPLVTSSDMDGIVSMLAEGQADTALAVAPISPHIWRQSNGAITKLEANASSEFFTEAAGLIATRVSRFRETTTIPSGTTILFQLTGENSLRVTSPTDLEVAELHMRRRQSENQESLLPAEIGAVVFDFDGVFTDNLVMLDQDGQEAAVCSRGDGMGIGLLKRTGIPLLVLSKEPVPIVVRRCEKLGLECLHGVDNKLPLLDKWLSERGIERGNTIYMGNDVNDKECLAAVGCGVVPADAHPDVVPLASLVLEAPGGRGAVRQLCDLVCRHCGH